MSAFDKYAEIFVKRARELMKEEDTANSPEYREVLTNQLLGRPGPKRLERQMTPTDILFSKLFAGFTEIHNSYYSLLDIEVYLSRFPYPKTRVSKTRYLAYNMENYLNEVYILKERLISYCTVIGRVYRQDRTLTDLKATMKRISNVVQNSLKGVVEARGTHVHRTRFTDEKLDRLALLELVNNGPGRIPIFKTFYDSAYRTTRKQYAGNVRRNNEEIEKILDVCFEVIYAVVADEKGSIRYPGRTTA
jgi:hypothetical protein